MQLIALSKSTVFPGKNDYSLTKKTWLIMKMTIVLLTIACLQLSAKGYTQSVTLKVKNAQLEKVFQELKKQTGYDFWYESKLLQNAKRVTLEVKDSSLRHTLDECFRDQPFTYIIVDKIIEVKLNPQNGFSIINPIATRSLVAPTMLIDISGIITDDKGEPLVGATIIVKGTPNGTKSDVNGHFTINAEPNSTLIISFVGFESSEVKIDNRTNVTVQLKPSVSLGDEVVVGYGTEKKVNLTGAIGFASSERLENRTITSLGQGLQGVIPGLNITFNSGDPNKGADFNIRGFESINGGSPLILVDGVPMDVEKINPNDIKSVSVLKDAASAAIYGARAAFGVILIETKKGQIGKTRISFSNQTTLQKAIFPGYEPVKQGGTARQIQEAAYELTSGRELLPKPVIGAALAYQDMSNPTTDDAWMYYQGMLYPLGNTYMKDLVMRNFAPQQEYDLNISGASDKANYYV